MFTECHVLHEISGRVRFRIPELRFEQSLIEKLEYYISERDGIDSVRINLYCYSIVIYYSDDQWDSESLEKLLKNISRERLSALSVNGSLNKSDPDEEEKSKYDLILSSMAVLTGWAIGPPALPVVGLFLLGSSQRIFTRAFDALTRRKKLNVDALDASATLILAFQGQLPTAAFMVWLINLGDYIRSRTMEYSKKAIGSLFEFENRQAWLVTGITKKRISLDEISVGNRIVVYTGEMIPADGVIYSGAAMVDQHTLTGESEPVEKSIEEKVYASTVVREGKIYFKVQNVGNQTEAAKIVQMIQNAPTHDTRVQNYAEEWADKLVPYSFSAAGVSILLTGGTQQAASLLLIDYGTGIRVVAPTTVLSSMTRAARNGILIKGGRYIEKLAEVDAIIFDKTGTLTQGNPRVTQIIPYKNGKIKNKRDLMTIVAAAEQRLSHPVAEAISEAAKSMELSIPVRSTSDYKIGYGIEAGINGSTVHVGSKRYFIEKNIPLNERVLEDIEQVESQAVSPVIVAEDHQVVGLLGLADPIRPDAREMILRLKSLGIKEIVMLTGDRDHVAKQVADSLNIDRYISEVFPKEKLQYVKQLQNEGYTVAVVGDGINDSPALAQADAGIAVEGGTDVAQETAHVVLHNNELKNIPLAIEISRNCIHLIKQNWNIIAVPNTVAIGMTLFGLIGPIGATVISNGSAIAAGFNALRPLIKDDQPKKKLQER